MPVVQDFPLLTGFTQRADSYDTVDGRPWIPRNAGCHLRNAEWALSTSWHAALLLPQMLAANDFAIASVLAWTVL